MVFASLTFLYVFLPITLVLYYAAANLRWKNGVLIVCSLLFYAWGEPMWTSLLVFSAAVDYLHGRIIRRWFGKWQAKAAVASSLLVNLGLLASFKYSGFLVESVNGIFRLDLPVPEFVLPIGISFYTFQTISYTIDVYRGRAAAQESFWKFLLFVSLFHQLVAGPIVRYRDIAKGIEHREFRLNIFSSGVSRFAIGLAKKVVLANPLGAAAAGFLDGNLDAASFLGGWWGILLFAFQIYFDFSGYSDMAIGLGRMFGFEYRENFRYPYVSRSATEFWRRWHISLGSFFRDYLYIPLGGNRKRVALNLLIVWFLTGLWHGAGWNFVLWGLYYGILIGIEKLVASSRARRAGGPGQAGSVASRKLLGFGGRVASHFYLLVITLLGWTFFYFTDLSRMGQFFGVLFGFGAATFSDPRLALSVQANVFLLLAAVVCSLPVFPWFWRLASRRGWVRGLFQSVAKVGDFGLLAASTILLVGASYNPFLYTRF